jgi:hypothetical protein
MADEQHQQAAGDLPADLARQLTRISEAELRRLHGMGPKALDQLRRALAASGRTFADAER